MQEGLKKELKEESVNLRERGFAVDEECRIDPNVFREFLGKTRALADVVDEDNHRVELLEKRQKYKDETRSPAEKLQELKGEILEMNKTLAFNQSWFGKRLVAVRTAKYDDFENHVDQLILDTKTGSPFAAVDITTDWKIKAQSPDLAKRLQKGCQVKYGFKLNSEGKVQKQSHDNLPLFIIAVSAEESSGSKPDVFLKKEKVILESLQKQSEQFYHMADPEVGAAYQKAAKVFKELGA